MSDRRPQQASGPSPTTSSAPQRWPRAGPGQKALLLGAVLMVVGSFLPWVDTPFGNFTGMQGAGVWTFYAGVAGIAGAIVPRRLLALGHAVVTGLAGVGLTGWQLARIAHISATTGSWGALLPSIGLLLVATGGVLALRGAQRLHRRV